MNRSLNTSRIVCIIAIMMLIVSIYASALYELQINKGENYLQAVSGTVTMTDTVPAARGSILDRNGEVLVYSKTVYNVVINRTLLMKADSPNSVILDLCKTAIENGINYVDTFPVTKSAPFSYVADMDSTQRSRLDTYFEYFGLDDEILASDLISWMREHYDIDYTLSMEDARLIIGVRYEMECQLIMNIPDYAFCEDADANEISVILEQGYPGVTVKTSTEREYTTPYAMHLLGYVGKMNSDQYEQYKDLEGYYVNTDIGREGVEATFEEYLHGIDGSITYTTNTNGNITGILSETEAVAGNNVYLTIDIGLQAIAEESLASTIKSINEDKKENDDGAQGGAVIVRDVNSGDVLVSASYPTYSIDELLTSYTELSEDPLEPLFNRATQGVYNPGSTFKMVTAFAALKEGVITRYTTIEDKGIYTEYPDYQPKCWVYPDNHGVLDVVGALENSCNYFFYTVADKMDIDPIADAAAEFGLGSKTGIEIAEAEGILATREYKKEVLGEGWWAADTLLTCIGQGNNYFTPIQIANYISAIANDGTVYETTILKNIKSADYSETILEGESNVLKEVDDPYGYLSVLRQGMRAVAETGTAESVFGDYPVKVAAKTGTVQSETSDNTGVFVCYAPYDNPQIAITVVVEGGGSGSALAGIAKDILDVYFEADDYSASSGGEYSLIQ